MPTLIRVIGLVAIGMFLPGLGFAQGSGTKPPVAAGMAGPTNPEGQLKVIEQRSQLRKTLFRSPLQPALDGLTAGKKSFYDATNIKLGLSFHTVFQYSDSVISGTDDSGTASDLDFVGTWEILNAGTPTQGVLAFGIEGRWEYGRDGPQTIGFANIGAAGGTANTYSKYEDPQFIVRNLYWKQGSPEAGWVYRIGKITTDAILFTNANLTPNTTFLSNAGTGQFGNGYADSGFGFAGALYFDNARGYVGGAITDANGDRSDWGDISEGDFYAGLELGYKIRPMTDTAGYSKFLLWHTDGTSDGTPINANTGNDGWGWGVLIEQQLSTDGNIVAVGRFSKSYDKAAIYDTQGALAVLIYEPFDWFDSDVIGFQYNYIDPFAVGSRDEHTFEAFYRLPVTAGLDASFMYQHVHHPGNTRVIDSANVFSVRLVASF